MSFASCAVSRGRLSRLVDTSPDAGAPPSLFHRLIALAFMSASVDGVFALLLMPQLCHGCRGLSMASRRVRFQRPTTNVRNRTRSALLMYANLAGVTRLPYGGALTLDALT